MQACSNVKSDKDSVNLDTIIDGSSPLERACREAERKFGKQVLRIPCTRAMRRIRACKQRGTCMNREVVPHPQIPQGESLRLIEKIESSHREGLRTASKVRFFRPPPKESLASRRSL